MAKDLQSPASVFGFNGRRVWRILNGIADLLTFMLVVALSAAAVVVVAIAAPVAVGLSALSGRGRRGRWRAALAA